MLPEPISAEYACTSCRTPFLSPQPLDSRGMCLRCRSGVAGYDFAFTYGYYEGVLMSLIHDFKYSKIDALGEPLGKLMIRALPVDLKIDCIVPVPLHWSRRMWRGFNQTELLAAPIARRLNVPIVKALRKRKHTTSQALSTPAQRRANLIGALQVSKRDPVAGKRVLLIDDVYTTGSTLFACSKILRGAGAISISVLTLARVDRRPGVSFLGLTAATGGDS